jgi:hypothetical protein
MGINIVIGVVIAAVVAGGAWLWHGHVSAPTVTTQATTTASASAGIDANEGTTTFGALALKTGSWKCTVHSDTGTSVSDGTAYIADGNVSADFSSQVSGKTVDSHMITADGYAYTWSNLLPMGVKVKLDASAGTSGGQGIDASTEVKYSCAPWTKDAAKFTLPTTISFTDVAAIKAGVPGAAQGSAQGMINGKVPMPY